MKTVLIYSGGLDSTVMLYHLLEAGHTVAALTVNYGQRHYREIESAKTILQRMPSVQHEIVDLRALTPLWGKNALTDTTREVPSGHYTEERMKKTVVPNRNMILLSTATAWALSLKADAVAYAAHAGDHAIYPDCRESFANAMQQAIELSDWHPLTLVRPFVNWSKEQIARRAIELSVPIELTWSCYQGGNLHCGRCGTCVERREAFDLAGINDPTIYALNAPSIPALKSSNWKL
jgi:7-cyano-7-deazaguanine synthase